MDAFRYPSDVAPDTNSDQKVPSGAGGGGADCNGSNCVAIATSNYVGSNHSYDLERDTGAWNGVLSKSSYTRFADITDGTSNTFALGERTWELGTKRLAAAVALFANGDTEANSHQGLVYSMAAGRFSLNCTAANCERGFSSLHPGGALFSLADGSVRFIANTIDHDTNSAVNSTYEYLISRNDGQTVGNY